MNMLYWILTAALLALGCSQPSNGTRLAGDPAPQAASLVDRADRHLRPGRGNLPSLLPGFSQPAKDALASKDIRSGLDIARDACNGRCKGSQVTPILAASTYNPIIPASWTVPGWYIDPANSVGCASDTNSGTAATCSGGCNGSTCQSGVGPLQTYAELAQHRYGTYEPRLQQITTYNFLSSASNGNDPVRLDAYYENSAYSLFQCPLGAGQTLGTGTITVAQSLVRENSAHLLQVTLPGSFALSAMLLVQNTTHSSFAWTYTQASGRTWNISQPIAPTGPPTGVDISLTEVSNWTTGDTVVVYQPVLVNFDAIKSNIGYATPGKTAPLPVNFYHCIGYDPAGLDFGLAYASFMSLNGSVIITEAGFQRGVQFVSGPTYNDVIYNSAINSIVASGSILDQAGTQYGPAADPTQIYGGFVNVNGFGVSMFSAMLGYDVIMSNNPGLNEPVSVGAALLGNVYLDTGTIFTILNASVLSTFIGDATTILYGPGTLSVSGRARLSYPTGAGAAAANLKVGTIELNEGTSACLGLNASGLTCPETLSAANLDSSLGASHTGCFLSLGGASICNTGENL